MGVDRRQEALWAGEEESLDSHWATWVFCLVNSFFVIELLLFFPLVPVLDRSTASCVGFTVRCLSLKSGFKKNENVTVPPTSGLVHNACFFLLGQQSLLTRKNTYFESTVEGLRGRATELEAANASMEREMIHGQQEALSRYDLNSQSYQKKVSKFSSMYCARYS